MNNYAFYIINILILYNTVFSIFFVKRVNELIFIEINHQKILKNKLTLKYL